MNTNKETAVIIPAYNSSKTIIMLLKEILRILPGSFIYIVEDSSPDGTGKIIERTFRQNKYIHLFIRKKKAGRGSAVLFGLKKALKNSKIQSFIEMDADFYHDPKLLPKLLKFSKKADVIIASRYVGGSQIQGWTIQRKIFSRIANLWARFLLGLSVNDYTNGYRLYNRAAAEIIVNKNFKAKGFAVLSEILVCLAGGKKTFYEIPTTVTYNPEFGSNFSLKEIKEAFFTVLFLRFSK